jgi:hypothetical protein
MFVGHLGAGLALRRFDSRVNAGVLVFAALFSDVVLWILVLVGVEQVHVPSDFAALRYQRFTFPWSHGLAASLAWAALAGGSAWLASKNGRAAAVVAVAVSSHFLLDWIEHPPEMPVLGPGSPQLGLGLWNHLGWALLIEGLLALAGLGLYVASTPALSRRRALGMGILVVAMMLMAFGGQLTATEAPPVRVAAISSLILIGVISGIAAFVDRGVRTPVSDDSRR